MNEYLQKLNQFLNKGLNYIQANNLKNRILKNQINFSNETNLDTRLLNKEVISILLKNREVIEKLNIEKILYNYVIFLEDNEKLNFLNENIELIKTDEKLLSYIELLSEDSKLIFIVSNIERIEEKSRDILELALKTISIEKLLNTSLIIQLVNEFPKECYIKIKGLGKEKIEEFSSEIKEENLLDSIVEKIYEYEDDKYSFLNLDIDVEEKIKFLRKKEIKVYMREIIKSKMNDNEKIKIISELNLYNDNINVWIDLDISEELKSNILNNTPPEIYRNLIEFIFPDNIMNLNFYRLNNIVEIVSKVGERRIIPHLNAEEQKTYLFGLDLLKKFDKEEIEALIRVGFNFHYLEKNFLDKNLELLDSNISIKKLIELHDNDDLLNFKKYYQFRKGIDGLDFCESLYNSLLEYEKNKDLYNEIINNYEEHSKEKLEDIRNKWNDLMNLENKFNIKTLEEFENLDLIETKYYSNILKNETSDLEIKKAIFEILVRNNDIDSITKLGNGIDYTMESESLEDLVDLLTTVTEMTDSESIRGILKDCINLIGTKELSEIRKIGNNIEQQIIQEYRKGYVNSFTKYDKMTDEEIQEIEGIEVKNLNGCKVIELNGADFSFLSHSGGIIGGHVRCCCSQITNDDFSTFGSALHSNFTYIFSDFSPNRIKFINLGDAGCSEYINTYISPIDLSHSTQESKVGKHNEVTLSTRTENGDDGLTPSAIMISRKNILKLNEIMEYISSSNDMPKTIYVLNEEIYEEKKKNDLNKMNEIFNSYIKTLDPNLLNLIVSSTNGKREKLENVMSEIRNSIKIHIDEKIGKSKLRRNVTRYWQFSRKKNGNGRFTIPYEIMTELQQELEKMDNELMIKDNLNSRIKEITDDYEYER